MAGRIFALILGILAAALGLVAAGFGASGVGGPGARAERFSIGATLVPAGLTLLAIGLAGGWQAARALGGRPSRAVALPPWWLSAGLALLAVGGGWAALRADRWWLFLPLATLAVVGPVAAVGRFGLPRGGPRPSWRRLLPALAWGAFAAPPLALLFEGLAALGAFVAALVGFLLGGGQRSLDLLRPTLGSLAGRTLTDAQAQALGELLVRQPVTLALGGFVVAFVAPAVEEFCKFCAVLLFGRARPARDRPRDSTLTIFLLGLAAGLGFALVENIFYAAQGGPGGWPAMALLRGATPVMHGAASALFALGWARQARDPAGWALLRGAVGALALHGAWNLSAGLALVAGLAAGGANQLLAGLVILALVVVLAALALGGVAILLRLRRALGAEAAAEERAAPPSPAWRAPRAEPVGAGR